MASSVVDDSSRYNRQLALPGFSKTTQDALARASVLVVGLGGLGSPAASYLAAAGVGKLLINDCDTVHISNLHRQLLYDESMVGKRKSNAAAERLTQINGSIELRAVDARLDSKALKKLVAEAEIVLDCTDNFASRQNINLACVHHQKMLVSGAAVGLDGQITVFPCDRSGPCYQCFLMGVGDNLGDCEGNGILGPVTGVIGSMMALETIKLLARLGRPLAGRMLIYDGSNAVWKELRLRRNTECPECGNQSPK